MFLGQILAKLDLALTYTHTGDTQTNKYKHTLNLTHRLIRISIKLTNEQNEQNIIKARQRSKLHKQTYTHIHKYTTKNFLVFWVKY